jgi:serine protease inhibitor
MVRSLLFDEFRKLATEQGNGLFSPLGNEVILQFLLYVTKGETQKELKALLDINGANQLENLYLNIKNIQANYDATVSIQLTIKHMPTLKLLDAVICDIPNVETLDLSVEDTDQIDTAFELICEIVLEDLWFQKFEAPSEKYLLFTGYDGSIVPLPAIQQHEKLGVNRTKFLRLEGLEGVQIPLKSGALVLEIFKPEVSKIDGFLERFSEAYHKEISNSFVLPEYLDVHLPEFIVKSHYTKNKSQGFLGLQNMFIESADFDLLFDAPDHLFIKEIGQQNEFEINERGIKAASKTTFKGGIAGISKEGEYQVFEADSPFVYVLRDLEHDLVFYLGVFRNPSLEFLQSEGESELENLKNMKKLKYFKPYIYQLSTRGKIFLCMLFLKMYIEDKQIDVAWLRAVLNDIYKILVQDDEETIGRLSKLNFSMIDQLGLDYLDENEYFSKAEMGILYSKYNVIVEVISSICDLMKYPKSEADGLYELFKDRPFKTVVRAINLVQERTSEIANLNLLNPFIDDNEKDQRGRFLDNIELLAIKI